MNLHRSVTLHTRRGGTWCWRKGLAIVIAVAIMVGGALLIAALKARGVA